MSTPSFSPFAQIYPTPVYIPQASLVPGAKISCWVCVKEPFLIFKSSPLTTTSGLDIIVDDTHHGRPEETARMQEQTTSLGHHIGNEPNDSQSRAVSAVYQRVPNGGVAMHLIAPADIQPARSRGSGSARLCLGREQLESAYAPTQTVDSRRPTPCAPW
ncbi:hypothetical protein VTK73DRAFT_8039 [Phialemonium thermophilum]|uniref:Uncharacterized protein n=1 Tax=Phialemonium thermophilum TaxID=223376 RepID=A0ABR3WAS3_9PEZI